MGCIDEQKRILMWKSRFESHSQHCQQEFLDVNGRLVACAAEERYRSTGAGKVAGKGTPPNTQHKSSLRRPRAGLLIGGRGTGVKATARESPIYLRASFQIANYPKFYQFPLITSNLGEAVTSLPWALMGLKTSGGGAEGRAGLQCFPRRLFLCAQDDG